MVITILLLVKLIVRTNTVITINFSVIDRLNMAGSWLKCVMLFSSLFPIKAVLCFFLYHVDRSTF